MNWIGPDLDRTFTLVSLAIVCAKLGSSEGPQIPLRESPGTVTKKRQLCLWLFFFLLSIQVPSGLAAAVNATREGGAGGTELPGSQGHRDRGPSPQCSVKPQRCL